MIQCWEVMKCELGPGGKNAVNGGSCIAVQYPPGLCHMVAGHRASMSQQCINVRKGMNCADCRYFALINENATYRRDFHWVNVMDAWLSGPRNVNFNGHYIDPL